jgi:hypothetical protein
MSTILYARVSTADQNLDHQKTQAEGAGFVIDTVVADHGVSGISTTLAERPEGRRLNDMLRAGDTLVVRWVDRLGRNYQDVVIVRSNVQHHLGTPRPSKFRRVFAAANEWLDPPHPSMFEPPKLLSDASMCAMVISTIEPRVDPSVPAFLGIGVPSPDLRRWIFRRSMTELIAMYRDRSAPEEKVPEVSVRDLAMPKLKE